MNVLAQPEFELTTMMLQSRTLATMPREFRKDFPKTVLGLEVGVVLYCPCLKLILDPEELRLL